MSVVEEILFFGILTLNLLPLTRERDEPLLLELIRVAPLAPETVATILLILL